MDKIIARIRRGQTSKQGDDRFSGLSNQELLELTTDNDACVRTSVIHLLGERKCSAAVGLLCQHLKTEKALYTRIAICEALGNIGETSIPGLIELLGKVGHNQHNELPQKGFYKKSYPLPRDIAVRTLIKIGCPALKPLEEVLLEGERCCRLEAIDGIGHIAFYEKNLSSEPVLLVAYQKYLADPVVSWKILRAFQAFPTGTVRQILEDTICSANIAALRWEAVRSLGQHGKNVSPHVLASALQDSHPEVRGMAQMFLNQY